MDKLAKAPFSIDRSVEVSALLAQQPFDKNICLGYNGIAGGRRMILPDILLLMP
jgi:hypothetical protein